MAGLPSATTVAPGDPAGLALACSPLIGHSRADQAGGVLARRQAAGDRVGGREGPPLGYRVLAAGRAGSVAGAAAPRRPTADSRSWSSPPTAAPVLAKPAGMSAVFGWQVPTWQPLSSPVRTWARFISPDGRFLAAEGTGAPTLWAWDAAALRHTPYPLRRKTGWRIGFLTAFSPDGGLVAATDPGDDLGLWDTGTRERRQVLRRYNRSFDVGGQALVPYALSDAVISPGGGFLAALGQTRDRRDKNVRILKLWDIADPGRRRRRLFEADQRHRALPLACRLRRRRRHARVDLRRAAARVGHGQPRPGRPRRAGRGRDPGVRPRQRRCWRRRAASGCASGTPPPARSPPPGRGSKPPATPSPASPSPRTAP